MGEPGIGKTRLVSEVAQAAHAAGTLVLAGRCDDGLDLPYQPFVEALEHLVEHAPAELLQAHVHEHGDLVTRLVPALAKRIPLQTAIAGPASESQRYALYSAIEDLLAEAAEDHPLLLVLEDLHWADLPTVLLLRRLLTSPRGAPMLVLSTCRVGQLGRDHPLRELLADLHREPGVIRLELDGLDTGPVIELLRGLEHDPFAATEQRVAETLKESTNGNPFFITELVRNLAETGALVRAGDRWQAASGVDITAELPLSITETLGRRISRLGPEVGRCLTAAAVIGYEFDLDLLRAVSDEAGVPEVLDRAIEGALLVEIEGEPRFRFTHALVQRYLYSELGAAARTDLHRRTAIALERRLAGGGISVAELARHWVAGSGHDVEKALRYAALAGDEALTKAAPDEARRWYGVALELHAKRRDGRDAERCELLIKRGEAERLAGQLVFRETLLEAASLAERIGDPDALVRAALANTRGMQSATGIVDDERIEKLDAALLSVGEGESPERAQLLATQAAELMFSGQRERRSGLSDEALAIARRLDDPDALSTVLNMRFVTLLAPDTHVERMANTEEAITAAGQVTDRLAQFYTYHWRAGVCAEAGDIDGARSWMAREREVSDRLRMPTTLWLSRADEANVAMVDGRLEDAARLVTEAFEIGQASEPDALACYSAQLTCVSFERGTVGDLVPLLEQVVEQNPGIPGFRSTLALALCEAGRLEDARPIVALEASSAFGELAYDVTWLTVACVYARVSARIGDLDAAGRLYELLLPQREMIAYPYFGVWGPVEHYLGSLALALGELDAAEGHLSQAARRSAGLGAPVWANRTALESARLLLARGDASAAQARAADVLAAAKQLGCEGVAREASSLLDARALASGK
jgi:tetratricopeptide (TPR) repeat protein